MTAFWQLWRITPIPSQGAQEAFLVECGSGKPRLPVTTQPILTAPFCGADPQFGWRSWRWSEAMYSSKSPLAESARRRSRASAPSRRQPAPVEVRAILDRMTTDGLHESGRDRPAVGHSFGIVEASLVLERVVGTLVGSRPRVLGECLAARAAAHFRSHVADLFVAALHSRPWVCQAFTW